MGTTESQATELVTSIKAMELRLVAELKDLEYQLTVRFAAMVGIWAAFIVAALGPLIILD